MKNNIHTNSIKGEKRMPAARLSAIIFDDPYVENKPSGESSKVFFDAKRAIRNSPEPVMIITSKVDENCIEGGFLE